MEPRCTSPLHSGHTLVHRSGEESGITLKKHTDTHITRKIGSHTSTFCYIPMYFFKPFVHTGQVILVMAWKNPYFVSFLILGQAYITPALQFHDTWRQSEAKPLANKITIAMLAWTISNYCELLLFLKQFIF